MRYWVRYILFLTVILSASNLEAKKIKALRAGEQVRLLEHDPLEKKPEKFIKIEEILHKYLDGEFVLARVDDIFPYEISSDKEKS